MSIKSVIVRELLTSDKSYSDIVQTVRDEIGAQVNTSTKCVAFYASKLRKIDKTCLSHRDKKVKSESLEDLIKKYQVKEKLS